MIEGGFSFGGVAAQAAGIMLGLGALAFSPPALGKMILLPIDSAARAAVLPEALAGGARIIAPGPLPASLVVYGDRAELARATGRSSVVIIAAPFAGCGEGAG